MPSPHHVKPGQHWRASDLRGLSQLAGLAVTHSSHIVENVHQSIRKTLGMSGGAAPGQTAGITGFVYQSVRGVTRLIDQGLQRAFSSLETRLSPSNESEQDSRERLALLAALNGVMGDKLQAHHSPFALTMSLRHQGAPLEMAACPAGQGKVLLLIHGLCMNDLQWCSGQPEAEFDHGTLLADALGYTPLYLRYNSGLHVSQNGHALAELLEQTLSQWPVPISELTVLAHSMGGLLIRSAIHYARAADFSWPDALQNIVFLGTPHHGAPLEKAGNWIDVILGSTPYSAPLAKIGQLRSAGITDLRYGHVLDEDWQGHDRFRRKPDDRQILPLPAGVVCYTIAATTASKRGTLTESILGDGLVPLSSALGEHADPQRVLQFSPQNQSIAYNTSHMALLSSPEVKRQLLQWLGDQAPALHAGSLPGL
ncbi:esterase/lipase family protein [Craterilacuibacter sinensis]|uniref:Alpha/beta hydrolase n=1 Tax=Craterilacuibacter sinensis TaxID=2686017 RepID=A0A845BUI9_9NEIS|nr:alpha/beta fold hydrolase [Craterilacuibacter sinensis]MXR36193.1 alpha/beta hydrolase [Craterilacuibacter sinensis]